MLVRLDNYSGLGLGFETLERSFFDLLRHLEDLSSLLQKDNLVSKEFAVLLSELYYSRDKLRKIKEQVFARVSR